MNIDVKQTALMRYLQAQGEPYYGKALELRDVVQGWLSYIPDTFPHYTRHTIQHSEEIISQISKLVFEYEKDEPIVRLTPVEAYILIAAAYLHDAGMVCASSEKLAIITSDQAWSEWISTGSGAPRWREVQEIRLGSRTKLPEAVRHFVADLQTRFLLAEFIRRRHHLRAGDVIRLHEAELGRFAFGDQMLIRTIGDICVSHGLRHFELDDKERFPGNRDIQGHPINVRLMAVLLRLGDLLDLSYDRACPLLLNAASPIPAESFAHWTQYARLSHRSTTPREIAIRAACENQSEHRVLTDWCQWIVDEVKNARNLMIDSEGDSHWQPPRATMEGYDATIVIRPSKTATYIPSTWTFEMDKASVLELLSKDLYQNTLIFIRELIQNAVDANRCQMYIDLRREGLPEPPYPTAVESERRDRYAVIIKLEVRHILNALSGELEEKQFLIIEDNGVGMDREVIERYFLQVGRSYYTTEEFRRTYRFAPTSRFGIGFLSVFAVSDWVTVDTYKPSSESSQPFLITITGPRNYLLTERSSRSMNGTRIEIQLREDLAQDELLSETTRWCKRLEFPVIVEANGKRQTLVAETASDFVFERADMTTENAQLFVKAFSINHPGLEGEVYVFGRSDERGEFWASSFIGTDSDYHPTADERRVPGSLICFHGIAMNDHVFEDAIFKEDLFGHRKASFRVDVRDKHFEPSLLRGWDSMLSEDHKSAIRRTLLESLRQHLNTTAHNSGSSSWKYKNQLAHGYELMSLWEACPDMIPMYSGGRYAPKSLADVRSMESLTTIHRVFEDRYDVQRVDEENLTTIAFQTPQQHSILGSHLALLDGKILSSLLDYRLPTISRDDQAERLSIVWRPADGALMDAARMFQSDDVRGYRSNVGIRVGNMEEHRIAYFIFGSKYPMYWVRTLWNMNHPFVVWLTEVKDKCESGALDLNRQVQKVFSFVNSYGSGYGGGTNLIHLDGYLKRWGELPNLSEEFYPPEIDIAEHMFAFLG